MSSRLIVLFAVLASVVASGQTEELNGIKIGDGRLHPYLDLEGRYDSAVGYFHGSTLLGDIAVRFRPGLRFELLGTDNVVHFNGNAEYVLYTGAFDVSTRQASRFQTDVGVDAAFNKSGAVEFQIGDNLLRSDRTNNPALTIGVISLYNNARVAVPIHPGGGALEFSPKVSWAVEFFEPLIPATIPTCPATNPLCQPDLASSMNYSNVNLGLGARWRFLPKTAVVFDGGVDVRTYFNGIGAPATLMKLQAGLSGLISSRVALLLLAGYGRDFAPPPPGAPATTPSASTFLGQAEVALLLSENMNFKVGYVRTLQPVPVYGVFGDDRGYLEGKGSIGRFSLGASVGYDFLTFYGNANRNDSVITVGVAPSVKIFSWFSASLAYNLNTRLSNASTPTGGTPLPGAVFTRHEVILKLSFSY
jgi:hypothetical protein